jgi:HSP20 family protein
MSCNFLGLSSCLCFFGQALNKKYRGDKNPYHRCERFVGTYQRSSALPGPVKESAMTTDYKNGVLTIIVPKA